MSAVALLAEAASTDEFAGLPSKWVFGGIALVTLLALLFIVTRFNIDR
jgi:hypothetical protein